MTLPRYIGAVVAFELLVVVYWVRVERYCRSAPDESAPMWARIFPKIWFWTHMPGIALVGIPAGVYLALSKSRNEMALPQVPVAFLNVAVLIGLGVLVRSLTAV